METIRKINKTICFLFTLINFIFYSNVCFASISWEILQQSFCSMSRKSTPLAAFFSHSTCLSLTQRTSLLQRTVRTVKPTFYYCLRDFSTDSKSLGANEPSISEVAKRILTIGIREPYDPVIGSLQHAFHSYQYWQRHYNYKDKVLIEDKNSQHQLFDRLLCERIEKQGFMGRLTLLNPDKVASYSIRQLFKKDSVIMVNPISWLVMKILPIWIKLPLMTEAIKREIEA